MYRGAGVGPSGYDNLPYPFNGVAATFGACCVFAARVTLRAVLGVRVVYDMSGMCCVRYVCCMWRMWSVLHVWHVLYCVMYVLHVLYLMFWLHSVYLV